MEDVKATEPQRELRRLVETTMKRSKATKLTGEGTTEFEFNAGVRQDDGLLTTFFNAWSVQKVSRILYFRGLRIFDFLWRYVGTHRSIMSTSSAILNIQLIFNSYFDWACFGSSSIFVSSV